MSCRASSGRARIRRVGDQQHVAVVLLDPGPLLADAGAAGQGGLVDVELLADGRQLLGRRLHQVDPDQGLRLGPDPRQVRQRHLDYFDILALMRVAAALPQTIQRRLADE